MRPQETAAIAILLTTSAIGVVGPASTAHAYTKDDIAINGTYRVTSIGNWAKINDQYNGEPTTVQTWTLSSTCSSYQECDGTLRSDEGWTTHLYLRDGSVWLAKHEVANWERCQDGTAFTGKQTFTFYPVDPDGSGELKLGSPIMAGKNKTTGPSGACGQNQWLNIEMPMRLEKIG